MRSKQIIAWVTALTFLGSVSGMPIYSLEHENDETGIVADENNLQVVDNGSTEAVPETTPVEEDETGYTTEDGIFTYSKSSSKITITGFADKENYPTSVYIPSSIDGLPVTTIGSSAFSGCTSLTSINITASVTSIRYSAFSGCTSLTSVGDLSSVTSIENYAFRNCTSLTSVGDLSSVTKIGCQAFLGCTSLTSIGDLSSVTSIDYSAFSGCTSLTSVGDLSSATHIEMYTFSGCTALTTVGDLSSATYIEEYAFKGCKALTSVGDLSSVTKIGYSAFENCAALTSVGDLSSVTTIESSAFENCAALTSVGDLSSVTTIESSAFEGCTSLTSIGDLSYVTYIGSSAFEGCTSLTSIGDLSSVTSIKYKVFYGCTSLTSIDIPSSVTTIGQSAFEGCTALTEIDIPSSVTTIENGAFKGCSSLTEIDIPSSVTQISSSTFEGCTALTSIDIPSSVTYIGSNAFKDCTSLTSVYIPSSATDIYWGGDSFENCTSLEYLNCNSDACMEVFFEDRMNFYNLKSITADKSIENYCTKDGVLYNKDMTELLWVPSMLECEEDTFVIPETVQTIGSRAFPGICKIKNVIALDTDERTLSYILGAFNKSDDVKVPEEKKKYYYTGTKPSVTDDWEAIDLTPDKDKVLNNYTIQVIDSETGEYYSGAVVQTKNGKYAALTDENGMAVFEIDEKDSSFWDSYHTFNVLYSGEEINGNVSEELDGAGAERTFAKSTLKPKKKGFDTININSDLIPSVTYIGKDVKNGGQNVQVPIRDVYDATKQSNDKLVITVSDKLLNEDGEYDGWSYEIYVTDAKFIRDNSGNLHDGMLDFKVTGGQINSETITFVNFADEISKAMKDDTDVMISAVSKIMIKIKKAGVNPNSIKSEYYLKCRPRVFNFSESNNAFFNSDILDSFAGFTGGADNLFNVPGFECSMQVDMISREAEFEATVGISTDDDDDNDDINLTDEEKKKKKKEKFYEDYPEAKYLQNKDGTPVENEQQLAGCPDAMKLLGIGFKGFDSFDADDINKEFAKTSKPYFNLYASIGANGTLETNPQDASAAIKLGGNIGTGIEFGLNGEYRIPQFANLAYLEAGLSGSASLMASVSDITFEKTAYTRNFEFKSFGETTATANFGVNGNIAAGIGVGDIVDANISANLEGAASLDLDDKKWKDTSIGGDITLSAKLLAWETSHKLVGATIYILDENGDPYYQDLVNQTGVYMEYTIFGQKHNNRESGMIEEENNGIANGADETLSASDFRLVRRSGNEIYPGISEDLLGADETSVSTEVVAQNVYAVSDPVIVSAGGSEYLFRFVDDTSRSAANCSKLVYSKKTDGVWSEPVAIADNSTADFDASVCTDGKDIYIAWCDISSVLSDSALYTDAITASAISTAKLDTSTDTVTELGTVSISGKSNLSPSVAVRNGSGIVTWVSNANPDPLTNTGNDEVYYSVISNGTLGSPQKYASSGANKLIGTAQAGYIGSKLCIVYSSAESGGKAETSELYGSVYTGTPIQLTSNEFADTRPQFEKLDGKDVMFWYYGGTILYSDSLGGEVNPAVTGLIDDRYAIASSGDVTKIAWRARNDEEQDIMKMSSYENGEFTNVYTGNKLGFDPSVINAVIDSAGNMQSVYTYKNGAQTDLAITAEVESPSVDIRYAQVGSDYVSGDEKVPLSVNIHNSGNRNLTDITINISDSAGNIVASYPTDIDIEIGEIADHEFEAVLPVPEAATTYTVSVEGAESDTAEFTIGYAAMYLEGETYEAGKQRFANIICRNDSNISSGGFLMTYIDGELISVTEISSMDSSASSLSQFNLTELAGSNNFKNVEFVLEGTKLNSASGATRISYEYDEIVGGVTTSVAEGVDVVLTADNDDNATSYLWQVNTGNGWEECTESGNTSEKLTISAVTSAYDGNVYRCAVTNTDGSTVYSTAFELDVISAGNVTEEMVDDMTVSQCAQFVNRFTADTEDTAYVLTAAQIKAVERVLEEDYK